MSKPLSTTTSTKNAPVLVQRRSATFVLLDKAAQKKHFIQHRGNRWKLVFCASGGQSGDILYA